MDQRAPNFCQMDEVINGKWYQTSTATLTAFAISEDSKGRTLRGLFHTRNGNFFLPTEFYPSLQPTQFPVLYVGRLSERFKGKMKVLSRNKALEEYWHLPHKVAPLAKAFPGVTIENA